MSSIALIRPSVVLPIGSVTAHQGVPPLGIAYLSASLRSRGHRVLCIDAFGEKINSFSPLPFDGLILNGLTIEETLSKIPDDIELIGISCMFSNEWIFIAELLKKIKEAFPDKTIVLGGEHATADYDYILKNYPQVSFCVLGEGEEKICEVMDLWPNWKHAKGIAYCENQLVHETSGSSRIKNISELPWPDWSGIPLEEYLKRGLGMAAQNKRSLPMLASRGCPYQCTFCSSEGMWTTRWVAREIDELIDEIKEYKQRYNIAHLEFYDLTAIVNKEWTVRFAQRLISENLGVTWSLPSGTRSEALTKEVLGLLKESGCLKLTYAPESASPEVIKRIKKRVKINSMLISMKEASRLGIIVKANMIFGFPAQKRKDLLWDIKFLFMMAWIGVHDVTCFAFVPYPGSQLFKNLLKENKIKRDENFNQFLSFNVYNSPLNMKSWSDEIPDCMMPILTLGGMAFFYSLQFLFRPWRFLSLIYKTFRGQPITMLELALDGIIKDFIKGRKILR